LARRRYQKGQILFSKSRQLWLGRYREDTIRPDGSVIRARPQIVLGTKKELPTQRLAARKLDEILSRINDCAYQPTRIATVAEFAARWREEVLAKRKPSMVRSANSHLDSHILPQLGKLRLDQVGPENQQVFVNQLAGASRKTVLNILSTLSSMLATAKNWGYSSGEIALRKLVLPERNVHVPAHFNRSQVESILSLANEPWRTFFIVLALTGLRAGEALGLQWTEIDFHHKCIRATTWWNIGFGQSSTRSIFRGAAFMLSGTPLRPSSWTRATRPESQNNSSAIPTPAQHSTTFICKVESQSGRWRTFQIP
jgi:hypothetical protein